MESSRVQQTQMHRMLIDSRIFNPAGLGRYTSDLVKALVNCSDLPQLTFLTSADLIPVLADKPKYCSTIKSFSDRYSIAELLELQMRTAHNSYDLFYTTGYVLPIHKLLPSIVTIHDIMRLRLPEYCHSNTEFIRRFGIRRLVTTAIIATVLTMASKSSTFSWENFYSLPLTDSLSQDKASLSNQKGFKFHHLYIFAMTLRSVKHANAIVTVSSFSKQEILYMFDINPEKIHVIYPGINPIFREVNDRTEVDAIRTKYNLPPRYFLYVGLKRRHKNLDRLIQAYSSFANSDADPASLVLAGPQDEDTEYLIKRVNETGLNRRVFFRSFISDTDLNNVYNGASALLLPSIYEGFGFPVIEAMACNVPVVASNIPPLKEISGEGALLVDPVDIGAWTEAFRRISYDVELRKSLQHNAKQNIQKFSWDVAASQLINLFNEVLVTH